MTVPSVFELGREISPAEQPALLAALERIGRPVKRRSGSHNLTDTTTECGRSVDREEDWFPR